MAERLKGSRIAAKGGYRDGVRTSHRHFVKTMGLRRVWALPFLTALAPSPRYPAERGVRHRTRTDWTRQMLRCLRRSPA